MQELTPVTGYFSYRRIKFHLCTNGKKNKLLEKVKAKHVHVKKILSILNSNFDN